MISLLCAQFGIGEIILVVACTLFVVGVAVVTFVNKKKGKSSCGSCEDCAHCKSRCSSAKKDDSEQK